MTLPSISPGAFAQQYATENNISLAKAKEELRAKYGDPDPNAFAQQYAVDNNISLVKAKEELKAQYGDPGQSVFPASTTASSSTDTFTGTSSTDTTTSDKTDTTSTDTSGTTTVTNSDGFKTVTEVIEGDENFDKKETLYDANGNILNIKHYKNDVVVVEDAFNPADGINVHKKFDENNGTLLREVGKDSQGRVYYEDIFNPQEQTHRHKHFDLATGHILREILYGANGKKDWEDRYVIGESKTSIDYDVATGEFLSQATWNNKGKLVY